MLIAHDSLGWHIPYESSMHQKGDILKSRCRVCGKRIHLVDQFDHWRAE